MEIVIEEAPQLIISLALIICATLLLVLKVTNVLEAMPLLVLITGYWIGNGTSRLVASKTEQTLTTPQANQFKDLIHQNQTQPLPIIVPVADANPQTVKP